MPLASGQPGQVGVLEQTALHVAHDVERGADDGRVLTQRIRTRNRDLCVDMQVHRQIGRWVSVLFNLHTCVYIICISSTTHTIVRDTECDACETPAV